MKKSINLSMAIWMLVSLLAETRSVSAQLTPDVAQRLLEQFPASSVSLDLSVPAAPAFVVLGVTPENVIRPTNPRSLATSLLYAIDQQGNLQSGFAVDGAPFLSNTTLADYRNNAWDRFLANTQVSLASTRGQDEADPSSRFAMGLHMVLLNRGDIRRDDDLINDFRSIIDSTPVDPDTDANKFDEQIAEAVNKALEDARGRAERKPIWTLAAAPSWISPSGESEDLEWDGYGVWTSFGFGFGEDDASQMILHARYRSKETVPDPDQEGEFLVQDSSLAGARWRAGSKNFKYSLEAGYRTARPEEEERDSSIVFALVFEPRIAPNLWLHLSLNGEDGGRDNDVGFKTSFKWGFDSD